MNPDELQGLQITLRFPDGRAEQLVVDSEALLVGSGAHCEVRIAPEHASAEHLKLSIVGDSVHAEARSFQPHPTIDGAEFVRTPVSPESVLGVGPVQIRAARVLLAEKPS